MAVTLNACLVEQCTCKTAMFDDTTGVYDSIYNPGGWGAPNTESSAITSASISITPKGFITPIVFNFTISNNEITAATRTDEFGATVDVFSLISNTLFPFYNFQFDSILIYADSIQSDLIDGSYWLTYTCSDGTDVFQNQQWSFFVGLSKRCKDDTVIRGARGLVTEENQAKIFLNYDYILGGVSLGDKTFVDEQVDAMASLCNTCGCGC